LRTTWNFSSSDMLREQRIDRLAAGHAVAVVVGSAIGAGLQVLDTGRGLVQRLPAQEAQTALDDQQAVKHLGGHVTAVGQAVSARSSSRSEDQCGRPSRCRSL
jgi:hypothetical protein